MKIRQGFVSNSSSTSFTLFGIYVDPEEFEKKIGQDMYKYAGENGLRTQWGDPDAWGDDTYLGLVVAGEFEHCYDSDMRDDETRDQFKQRVIDALPDEYKDEASMHSESFYNG